MSVPLDSEDVNSDPIFLDLMEYDEKLREKTKESF
jgi:hypothetical protein